MGFFGSLLKGIGKGLAGAATLIPGVGSFLSDGLNSIIGDAERSDAISQQTSLNKEMMTYQHDLNRADWEAQNAYNTPLAQMQRITDAGINPLTQSFTGFQASLPFAVNSQSPPDVSSLLNYQMALRQFNLQSALTHQEIKGKKIENKVAEEEGKARIAEAKDREQEALTNIKLKNRVGSPPDGDGWIYNEEKNVWTRQNPDSLEVETLLPGTVRDDIIRSRIGRELDEGRLVNLNYLLNKFEYSLKQKFGEKLTQAQLNQVNAIIRNAALSGDLQKLDVDTFKKLGLGPNVIRALVSTSQAFGGQLNGMIGAAEMIMK